MDSWMTGNQEILSLGGKSRSAQRHTQKPEGRTGRGSRGRGELVLPGRKSEDEAWAHVGLSGSLSHMGF